MAYYLLWLVICSLSKSLPGLAHPLRPRSDNGLAITPPMGWNSYNHYSCSPNQSIIMSNAQAVVDLGLKNLGYYYVETDCGWSIPNRLDNGSITWNETLFPAGFPVLGNFIHGLGLGFGVYADSGIQMCMTGGVNQTGSLFHEVEDAKTFADWNADLLKYDNCYSNAASGYPDAEYNPSQSPAPRFKTMANALNATGRKIAYAICEWGLDFPSAWAPAMGNTWRVTNDIIPAWRTIPRILNQVVPQTTYAGPGHWLDLDMLEVGNNVFTKAEEQTHFSMWGIIKSPLIIGGRLNDTLGSVNLTSLAILKNEDVISYNQDSLGIAASFRRRWTEDQYELWAGPLSKNRTVVALINWADVDRRLTINLPDVGLQFAGLVKDVWQNKSMSNVRTSYTAHVAAHGTMLLELSDTLPSGHYDIATFGVVEDTNTTNFFDICGFTSSEKYILTIFLSEPAACETIATVTSSASAQAHTVPVPAFATSISIPIALTATTNNAVRISTSRLITILSATVTAPIGVYYPATSFILHGNANRTTCPTGTCTPVGSKIGNLSPNGSASIVVRSPYRSAVSGPKYISLDYTNNDVAIANSWTNGTNTRNLTIAVNGHAPTRLELPLSGRSSELFSVDKGWDDSGNFGVLVEGFKGGNGEDEIVIGNVGGADGIQPMGAEFVGMRVIW